MATTNLFSRPGLQGGCVHRQRPRGARFSVKKTCEAIDLGAELGAQVYVMWGGREGVEADAAKDVQVALDRYKEAVDLCCEHIRDRGLDMRIALEPKPNEPRGDIFLPTVGHALAFIGELEWPDMVGLNPEFAHETMTGLSFHHGVAQALWHGKLFHIDLNGSGSASTTRTSGSVPRGGPRRFLHGEAARGLRLGRGMRHFDAHPYRTDDADGVWDFARGCMRTYLILAEKAGGSTTDPEIQDALAAAMADAIAEPTRACRRASSDIASGFDEDALAAQGYGHERLDQLVTELLLGARVPRVPLVVGVDSSTSACKVEVRDADTGAVIASGGHPTRATTRPAASRTQEWWRRSEAPAPQAGARRAPAGAIAVAGQQHGLVVLDDRRGAAARPSCGTTPSRRTMRSGWSTSPGGAAAWAAACGSVPVAERSRSPSSPGCARASPTPSDPRRRCSCPTTGSRRGSPVAHHRPGRRLGHRLLVARPRPVPHRPARARRRHRTGSAPPRGPGSHRGRRRWRATARGRAGHRRQHGRRPRRSGSARRPRAELRHQRHRVHGQRQAPAPTRRAPSPASPTPPGGSSPWSARSTRPRSPTPSPACSASTTPSSTLCARRPPAPAGSCSCPTSTASARPTCPTPPARSPGCARRDPRAARPRPSRGSCATCWRGRPDVRCRERGRIDRRIVFIGGGARSAAYRQVVADLTGRVVVVPAEEELVARCRRAGRCGAPRVPGSRRSTRPGTSPRATWWSPTRPSAADVRATSTHVPERTPTRERDRRLPGAGGEGRAGPPRRRRPRPQPEGEGNEAGPKAHQNPAGGGPLHDVRRRQPPLREPGTR